MGNENKKILSGVLALALIPVLSGVAAGMIFWSGPTQMEMAHMKVMLNHGLVMILDGSNLVMVSEIDRSDEMDEASRKMGLDFMEKGKTTVTHILSGEDMMKLHEGGHKDDPMMKTTHELGEYILKIADLSEKMSKSMSMTDKETEMHHMHIMLNHAMKHAAGGWNVMALGRMGMGAEMDEYSEMHGRNMIRDARALIVQTSDSQAMKEMHSMGMSPEKDTTMKQMHHLTELYLKLIDFLSRN
jgi:hypothetical protein